MSKSRRIKELFAILPDLAVSDSSVLIEGPSGTGKELFARAIHNASRRNTRPLVVINCAAVPDNLLESELFGYKAGAFTDAKKDKPGKIARAEGGTLFLDEIGELSILLQVKLLRFIQEREYEPLGGGAPVRADVRIITATNKNLLEEVGSGRFRDDLYYRLNVFSVKLPSLAERMEDIPILVDHFIRKFNVIKEKNITGVTDEVMNVLMNHDYPGNIRELENIIEHAFVLCREAYIRRDHLPRHLQAKAVPVPETMTLEEIERMYIIRSLEKNGWNRSKTALGLGIDTSTLWRKMKKFSIEEPEHP